jgi:hypothetical protein
MLRRNPYTLLSVRQWLRGDAMTTACSRRRYGRTGCVAGRWCSTTALAGVSNITEKVEIAAVPSPRPTSTLYSWRSQPDVGHKVPGGSYRATSKWPPDAHSIATTLWFNAKAANSDAILRMLPAFTEILKPAEVSLNARDISLCLFAMKLFGPQTQVGILPFLQVLTEKLHNRPLHDFLPMNLSQSYLGLRGFDLSSEHFRPLMTLLNDKLRRCREQFRLRDISTILCSLQNTMEYSDVIEDMLAFLLTKNISADDGPDSSTLTQLTTALKIIPASDANFQKLVSLIAKLLDHSNNSLDSNSLSFAIGHLENASSQYASVQHLIKSLANKINRQGTIFSEYELGNASYGLKCFDNTHTGVDDLLAALCPSLKCLHSRSSPATIVNLLYGLKMMGSTATPGLKGYLQLVSNLLDACNEAEFSAMNVNRMLAGVQSCRSQLLPSQLTTTLARLISGCSGDYTGELIGASLHSLRNTSFDSLDQQMLLQSLTRKIDLLDVDSMTAESVCLSLNGFKRTPYNIHVGKALLLLLKQKAVVDEGAAIHGYSLALAFEGMHSLKSSYPTVVECLRILGSKIHKLRSPMRSIDIAMSIRGLASSSFHTSSKHAPIIKQLMFSLTNAFVESRDPVTLKMIGYMLIGLDDKAEYSESKLLISAIADKLCVQFDETAECSSDEFATCMAGLGRLNCEIKEVRRLLHYLTPKLASFSISLSPDNAADMMCALQAQESSFPESAELIDVVTNKLSLVCGPMDGRSSCNALLRLQNLSTDHSAVQELMDKLAPMICVSGNDGVNLMLLSRAFYGLQNMSSEIKGVKDILLKLISGLKSVNCNNPGLINVGMMMYGLQNKNPQEKYMKEWIQLLTVIVTHLSRHQRSQDIHSIAVTIAILDKMDSCEDVTALRNALVSKRHEIHMATTPHTPVSFANSSEKRLYRFAREVYRFDRSVVVEPPGYLHDFEADLVLRRRTQMPCTAPSEEVVNVELDGERHSFSKRKRFCKFRDEILRNKGVRIIRLPANLITGSCDDEIKEILKNVFPSTI